MMNDLNMYGRISDLFYKDMLGLADEEEKRELDSLLVTYKLKGLDREKIIARLQEQEVFDGKEAYRGFRALKQPGGRSRRLIWWTSIAASVVVLVVAGWWFGQEPEPKGGNVQIMAEAIQPGQSRAVVTLADGQQIVLEQVNRKIAESDGTVLHSDSGTLVYTANAEKTVAKVMYNKVSIPRGGEYRLELADGTKVWLNAATELRFPVNFTGDMREVYLKGEAYFQVKRDEKHPFIVHTSMGAVEVLGTSFNVRDYEDEREVVTTLETGKVMYVSGNTREKVTLNPGYQVLEKESSPVEVRKVDPEQYTGWREGKYVFEDVTLEDIMRTLCRWYDIDVVYADPTVKKFHFTGDLERYESISVFLSFIETGGDVKFKTEGKTIIIDKK